MACSIQILHVNGIVPPGSVNPTELRVMGKAIDCTGNLVIVQSNITAQSGPISVDPTTNRFVTTLTITAGASPICDSTNVIVDAWCQQNPPGSTNPCTDQDTSLLKCCEISALFFSTNVFAALPTPSQIVVGGLLLGCFGNKVVVQAFNLGGLPITNQSLATTVDLLTGQFFIPLTVNAVVDCDEKIAVKAWCASDSNCVKNVSGVFDCGPCARVNVSVKQPVPQCVGTPPTQTQLITLDASVRIPKAQIYTFTWDYGDGNFSPSFQIDNSSGNASTPHIHPETHNYKAPGSYSAKLVLVSPRPEGCPTEFPLTVVAQCQPTPPACCDEVAITIDTQPLPCLPVGGGTVSVQFSATLSPAGCTGPFEWQVKDATTTPNTVIQPFTLGSSVFSYPFAKAGMYRVNVKVQQAITCDDPVLTHSVNVPIVQCITPTPCAVGVLGPQQTPCTDGAPTPLQTYTATTTTPFAGPYTWEVLKSPASLPFYQTQGGVSFPFAFPGPGTYTVTVSIQTQGCTNPTAGSSIIVTVPPCTPPCPPGQQRDTSGNCVPIPCPPGQSRDSSGNCVTPSRIGCDALLWISLILILISGVLGVIACIVSVAVPPPPGPIVAAVLGIIAAALLIIGLLLFLLWWAICRFFTACSVIIGAINFMGVLIAIFAIVAIVLFILGKFGVPVGVCWVSAAANSALWGLLLFILYRIAVAVRCITENSGGPPPPSPPSSSSSALSSSDVLRNRERTSFGDSSYRMERQVGLGDVVKMATSAMGIRPCEKCHERAARLNQWVAIGGKRIEESGS